jgi:hypothetical protein
VTRQLEEAVWRSLGRRAGAQYTPACRLEGILINTYCIVLWCLKQALQGGRCSRLNLQQHLRLRLFPLYQEPSRCLEPYAHCRSVIRPLP